MNAPWNNEDLRRAFDADFDALVAFASRSKARVRSTLDVPSTRASARA